MFGINYEKLKTNMKLSIQRLKLIEKKKTENTKKSTKEIADFVAINKYERARIKVEQIIREDYKVEAIEMVECYLDLLLARFGLLQMSKEIEPDLEECISSILWAIPRIESDCPELKYIGEQLAHKYGKEYVNLCRTGHVSKINRRLMEKLSEQQPSGILIEKYLAEIALSHRVPFNPDLNLVMTDPEFFYERKLNENSIKQNNSASSNVQVTQTIEQIQFPAVPNDNLTNSFDDLSKRFENLRKNL